MSKKSRISLLIMALLIVGSAVAVADPLEKLPRDVRLRFLESLTINGSGRPASAWIGGVKSRLSPTEWQDFKAMLGWGQLEDDHVGYSCYKAGDCAKVTDHICDPSKCTGLTFTLGSKLRVVSVAE